MVSFKLAVSPSFEPVSHGKERHIHANEGFFDLCGVDLVLIRTVLEGTDLGVVHAIAQVHCEVLPTLGE